MKRLIFSLLVVVVLALISLGWAIDQWYNTQSNMEEDPALTAYKKLGRELANFIDEQPSLIPSIKTSDLSPQTLAYENFPLSPHMQTPFTNGEVLILDSDHQLTMYFYLPQHNSVLSLNLPLNLSQESPDFIRWILTLVFYFGVILVVLLWLYPLIKRLIHLQKATQAFGNGDLTARIQTDKNSYICSIEQEFNRMAQRIEQLITDNKLLSRSLSHDLRTPLARLRFGIDVLHEGELPVYQQEHLAHIDRDLIAMESLIKAMLEYSKLDNAELTLKWQSMDLVQVTREYIDNLQNPNIQFITETESIMLQADPFYLHSLLQNLIENAIKHATQIIRIHIAQKNNAVILTVEDDGIGIADHEKEKVLQPFYRSTQNEKSGYGLGLAIANRIVLWHKGIIHIEDSNKLGGARMVVELNIET